MKVWNNYREILNLASRIPSLRKEAEELELLKIKGHNIKAGIKEIKEKLELILNDNKDK